MEIARYSKIRTTEICLGPFVAIFVLYLMFSDTPVEEIINREWNFYDLFIGLPAVLISLSIITYQMVTIVFLDKRFLWLNGDDLMLGERSKGPLNFLKLDQAKIDRSNPISDTVCIPRSEGAPLVLRTGLTEIRGAEVISRLKRAQDERDLRPRD